ncbi:hypothetical protein RB195_025826 [Necator americanus]|uniref:Uncharacterized protein n=1 Tax=Necator americanus TaxID=51031 RepID=A0ABR1EU33_NECAM
MDSLYRGGARAGGHVCVADVLMIPSTRRERIEKVLRKGKKLCDWRTKQKGEEWGLEEWEEQEQGALRPALDSRIRDCRSSAK